MVLFSAFDKPWSSFFTCYFRGDLTTWKPDTDEERRAFASLVAPENREDLRKWYAQLTSINAMADALRHILEREIGEDLPIGMME